MTRANSQPLSKKPRRPLWHGPLISVFVLVAVALAGEVAVRASTATEPPLLVVDPVLGRRYVRGFEGTIYNPESRREVPVKFNREGFRFRDLPFEKLDGQRRVAILGDSMVVALQVPIEQTAADLMERELNEQAPLEAPWEVLNFGVAGAGTLQEYVLHREVAQRYAPDHVICVFFVGNDFSDNSPQLSQRQRLYFDLDEQGALVRLPFPTLRTRATEFLNRHSRLYVWQKEASTAALRSKQSVHALQTLEERHAWHGERLRPSEYIYLTNGGELSDHAWKLTEAGFQALARDVQAYGATLTIVLLPDSQLVHREEFEYLRSVAGEDASALDPDHPARQLEQISKAVGARFLNLVPLFREAAPSRSELVQEEWLFLNGRGHLNVAGNALLARALAAEARAVRDL